MAPSECHEMLKAMYNFEATLAKTLSFSEGDHFVFHQSSTKQRNWWQVINNKGQIGFVPSNYVTIIQVEPQFLINFLDECITILNEDGTAEKQDVIVQLIDKKKQIESGVKQSHTKKQAPRPPLENDTDHSLNNGKTNQFETKNNNVTETFEHQHEENFYPKAESVDSSKNKCTNADHLHNSQSVTENFGKESVNEDNRARSPLRSQSSPSMQVPPVVHSEEILNHALYTMVERVRRDTQLSHDLSRVAVSTVLDCLKELVSKESCGTVWSLASLANISGPLPAGRALLRASADARRLRMALNELTSCARDSQQRAWALHDDNNFIIQHIQEVITILSNADVRISQDILSTEHYEYINVLISFYQMETRSTIKQLLIQAFDIMCTLDREAEKVLSVSVLPRELAREMLDNPKDKKLLTSSARLLISILSMGDPLPVSHFEQLDEYFLSFILQLIETPSEIDEEERLSDLLMTFILAVNLQFNDTENNLVLDALQSRNDGRVFTEKLLLLINREDDPVRVLEHPTSVQHSVLKLALDAFSRRLTASLFYTNDTKVLLDITVRQLADLSADDQRRGMYLRLCLGILRHTDYGHCHRQADLLRCFTRIFCEEGEASLRDQALIRTISNEFPQYFKA